MSGLLGSEMAQPMLQGEVIAVEYLAPGIVMVTIAAHQAPGVLPQILPADKVEVRTTRRLVPQDAGAPHD